MPIKYQVFVSSTYDDLKTERDQVIRAILEMGHIPVGMEMFSAADEEQWQIIARHIDESDYYCVILAHRYGSLTEGTSFTRKEYDYALSVGVPILGFVIDDTSNWPAELIDKSSAAVRKLNDFKAYVKQKPISYWKTAEDLYGKVTIALTKQITANPRDGWVRSSSLSGPEVTAELTRLSAENARLRNELGEAEKRVGLDRTAEIRRVIDRLMEMDSAVSYKHMASESEWTSAETTIYAWYLYLLGPAMASEVSVEDAGTTLAMNLRKDQSKPWWTVAQNQVRDLFADFMALGLAEPSKRRHAVVDKGEYWSLTPLGDEVHRELRQRMMVPADSAAQDPPSAEDSHATSADLNVTGAASKKPTMKKATAKRDTVKKATAKKTSAPTAEPALGPS